MNPTPEIPEICRMMLGELDRPETEEAHKQMHEELHASADALYKSGLNPDDFGSVLFKTGVERDMMPQEILAYAFVIGVYLAEQRRENSALTVWASAVPESILKL